MRPKHSDLVVKIKICQHPYLELTGKNIICTLVVPFFEAVLGKKIFVPTIVGKAMIKLYPLTASGKIYRLKGHGLAGGDQLINIEVVPWQKSSKTLSGSQFSVENRKTNDTKSQTSSLPNLDCRVRWVG